jgi:amidase
MEETSIVDLASASITEFYLERIERLDRAGPTLRSVIELNPDAVPIAVERDRERAAGRIRGPLHGVPILLKDNIATRDRMATSAGSLALEGCRAPWDAFLVRRLRAAGAVILGKANLSEWANFRSTRSVSGWSSRGGLTRNPYALDRTACGSSSGSAAAVAASFCAGAFGTETDGSVICPAQTCGVVGLKPTLGLISRRGIVPIAHSQDAAGPIGRTVRDVAILLGAVAGADPADRAARSARQPRPRDYTRFLSPDGLRGARIGVARNMLGTDKRILEIVESSLRLMRELGAVVIDPADLPNGDRFAKDEILVLCFEFKADLNRYLASLGPRCALHTLEDVIRFNEENRARVMPYFGQERMIESQSKGPLSSGEYRRALARCRRWSRREGIDAVMAANRLDAVVVASGGPAWTVDLVNGDPKSWDMESTSPAAVAGYPHITVPAGTVSGLPVGISFFAKAWQEPQLLRLAYAFEQARRARRPPRFLATAEV